MPPITMLDLKMEFGLFADEIRSAIETVLESQQFVNGPAVAHLEEALVKRIGAKHAVAVSSGTDALLCSLMALGIGPGHEVIVPALTFFATAGCVSRVGAKPVFVEVDPHTFVMDPEAVAQAVTEQTRAIIPVHLFGQCADMDALTAIAQRHKLMVVEDAAQAIGATYMDRAAGTLGHMACLSFYPTKNLGGFGEGGMILTNDDRLAQVARQLRNHGESQRYVHDRVGGNFRLDTLKAAILLVKLNYWDEFTRRRKHHAAQYDRLLEQSHVTRPVVAKYNEMVYHQYSVLCDDRDALASTLRDRQIATAVYYPIPLHLQKCFETLGYKPDSLPVTEGICRRILSLPCHPMLSEEEVSFVAEAVCAFHSAGRA